MEVSSGEGDGGEAAALAPEAADELRGQMLGVGGAAAVAAPQDLVLPCQGPRGSFRRRFARGPVAASGRIRWHRVVVLNGPLKNLRCVRGSRHECSLRVSLTSRAWILRYHTSHRMSVVTRGSDAHR
jgi:hypothetical protein